MHEDIHALTLLGLGNILLQDEGFGVHFVAWFAERWTLPEGVKLIDGGTLGYGLFDVITSCKNLIVIDTINVRDDPGSLYRFTMRELEFSHNHTPLAHGVEFPLVLCKTELIDRQPETTFLCIVPQRYDRFEVKMSPVMYQRYPDMERLLLKELAALAVMPVRIHDDAVPGRITADPPRARAARSASAQNRKNTTVGPLPCSIPVDFPGSG